MVVEKELTRILTLLRNKIRERGFTQLEVQDALGWGRSYISQLLTKQKSLRVEQVLLILKVIGVEPVEFYSELYHFMPVEPGIRNIDEYAESGRRPRQLPAATIGTESTEPSTDNLRSLNEVKHLVHGLLQVMMDKNMFNMDELSEAVKESELSSRSPEPNNS